MGMGVGGFLRRNDMKIEGKSLEQRNTWSESDNKTRYIGKVPAFVFKVPAIEKPILCLETSPNAGSHQLPSTGIPLRPLRPCGRF